CVAVKLAAEVELRVRVPAVPDRPHREDELAHSFRRMRPRGAEALLDVGLDLRPEPEDEATLRERLQVPAEVRQVHGAAGEGDGSASTWASSWRTRAVCSSLLAISSSSRCRVATAAWRSSSLRTLTPATWARPSSSITAASGYGMAEA